MNYAKLGCQTVVAAVGDGTINALVNALMCVNQTARPSLAIVPVGTANDFAGTLCIPNDLPGAIALIRFSNPRPVDLIETRRDGFSRYYANIAAGGNCVSASDAISELLL